MKILLVEDDCSTRSALAQILTAHHYTVNLATDGQTGLALAQAQDYDLILLDIIIPKLDGVSLCKRLRDQGFQNPIILLTAKDSSSDRVVGLDAGADDYVVKPYDPQELMARIRAQLRRGKGESTHLITWETLQLNSINNQVICGNQPIHLTPKEYCLLELFLLNPNRTFSRRDILDRLWDFAESPGEETVSTHIKCVRQKLKAAGSANPIETVHGLGYRLRLPRKQPSTPQPDADIPAVPDNTALKVTSRVWKKFRSDYIDRIGWLVRAAEALSLERSSAAQREQIQLEAHKLSGALGIFGLVQGSHLAKELEQCLSFDIPLTAQLLQRIVHLARSLQQMVELTPVDASSNELSQDDSRRLLIISDQDAWYEQLHQAVLNLHLTLGHNHWTLKLEQMADPLQAQQAIAHTRPDAILLDLNSQSIAAAQRSLLQAAAAQNPPPLILALADSVSLSDRVAAANDGVSMFVYQWMSPPHILTAAVDCLEQTDYPDHRVMVMDDDPAVLAELSNGLNAQGINVMAVENSTQFWETLTNHQPDLLVLDREMPDFNGIELCKIIRHDLQWHNLPILFFSAYEDERMIAQAFAAGADDYIGKSASVKKLIARISERLQRTLGRAVYSL